MKSEPDTDELLQQITELSHKFGSTDYVHGGGGNTSAKTEDTLWVKPSGTALKTLRPDSFVALDRSKLSILYETQPPQDTGEREKFVKNVLAEAKISSSAGRPSVEALLHDSLSARFVVHTHPALVNGMTCARRGSEAATELFPQALWLDYFDPGITLCMEVRRRVKDYKSRIACEPKIVFLKNHGVFVAADTPRQIEQLYKLIIERLTEAYAQTGMELKLPVSALPRQAEIEKVRSAIRRAWGEPCFIEVSGKFDCAEGPLSPDHIVYAKSFPFTEAPTAGAVSAFEKQYGYKPQVFVGPATVCGAAPSQRQAAVALELARDGALVKQLAAAFGGIEYITEAARRFIEGWEAETYRSSQI
jgi:rhamnose utilization protein RhaD (predicted bifunctional aldolase and dehydrogenase)